MDATNTGPHGAAKLFVSPAPLARFDDGFSTSDSLSATATLSGSEPELEQGEVTPTEEVTQEIHKKSDVNQNPPAVIPKYPVFSSEQEEHELQTSLLYREDSTEELQSYEQFIPQALAAMSSSFEPIEPDSDAQQLRKQYDTQATSRPRSTTPVHMCAIEDFVASTEPAIESQAERKMKVSIPDGPPPAGYSKKHRRRSSMSWDEFSDAMAQQVPAQVIAGRMSGNTSPTHDDVDILDHNPDYQHKVPPSPVVHRQQSMEWVVFDDQMHAVDPRMAEQPAECAPPPAEEVVAEAAAAYTSYYASSWQEPATPEVPEPNESQLPAQQEIASEIDNSTQEAAENSSVSWQQSNPSPQPDEPPAPDVYYDYTTPPQLEDSWQEQPVAAYDKSIWQDQVVQQPEIDPNPNPATDEYSWQANEPPNWEQPLIDNQASWQDTTIHDDTVDYPAPPPPISSWQDNTQPETTDWQSEQEVAYPDPPPAARYDNAAWQQQPAEPETLPPMQEATWQQQSDSVPPASYDSWQEAPQAEPVELATVPQASYDSWQEAPQAEPVELETVPQASYDSWQEAPQAEPVEPSAYESSWQEPPPAATYDNAAWQQQPSEPESAAYDSTYTWQDQSQTETAYDSTSSWQVQQQPDEPMVTDSYSQPSAYESAYSWEQSSWEAAESHTAPPKPVRPAPPPVPQPPKAPEASPARPPPPVPPAPKGHDPFSWEAQESFHAPTYEPPAPAPPRPAPPRTPEPEPVKKEPEPEPEPEVEEEEEDTGQSEEWKQFEAMTAKMNMMVKQTKEKLKELDEHSTAKQLKEVHYITREDTPPPAENLMDVDDIAGKLEEKQKEEERVKEWKPISEVLNEELKKQREASKPRRPPPPRPSAPKRPAGPPVAPSWDEDADAVAPDYVPPSHRYIGVHSVHYFALHRKEIVQPQPVYGVPSWDENEPVPSAYSKPMEDSSPLPPPPVVESYASVDSEFPAPPTTAELMGSQPLAFNEKSPENALDSFLSSAPIEPTPAAPKPPDTSHWSDFEQTGLKASDSDFFSRFQNAGAAKMSQSDAFAPVKEIDPFGPLDESVSLMDQSYDPFEVKSADQLVQEAKERVEREKQAQEVQEDLDFFGFSKPEQQENGDDRASSATPEGPDRPDGFGDDFNPEAEDEESPSPLYDEDDSMPLEEFPPKFTGDGWELMLRHPLKKKIMAERYWKPVYVRLHQHTLHLFHSKNDSKPFQELPLQASYCLSDVVLQAYDVYGKIHTVKLQYVLYKERVGIRPGQIPKLVDGHFTKLGLPLEHSAQSTQLLKFGSLNGDEIESFVHAVEDVLFQCPARREQSVVYKQDEVQVHCYDEYSCYVDKLGIVSQQKARVRLFCLAFVSGMPILEIGLNDRRRQGKEIVRRKDILPMYTERWIRFEDLQFHSNVDSKAFNKDHVIRLMPPDGCFLEVMRFRVRPPKAKQLPLQVKAVMNICGSKIEIRLDCMVAAFVSRKARQVPCEDIQIRFPIPEAWIYLFREERHWGVGSVHARVRRPGKVKNLRDRLMGAVQHLDNSLIEAAIGDAKYEHVHRALVWRIPRLPEKHHGAYKNHLLKCAFELSSFDLMPETFLPLCEVEYTMPLATVSHTVVRSVSVEQHEDSDRVEKFVRYLAKCTHRVEVDYVQRSDLDVEAVLDTTVVEPEKSMDKTPEMHRPEIDTNVAKEIHGGYRIDFSEEEMGGGRARLDSSSSEEEGEKGKIKPLIDLKIDMTGYGY